MRKIFCFLSFMTLLSCQRNRFEFDTVEHYRIKFSEHEITMLEGISDPNILGLLFDDLPIPTIDSNFQMKVEGHYRLNRIFQNKNEERFRGLLNNKILTRFSDVKCIPIFRDLLIFKKNKTITAISKICFDCNVDVTLDADGNRIEDAFSDFNELKKVLGIKASR